MKTQECIELELLLDGHFWEIQTQLWHLVGHLLIVGAKLL